MTRRVIGVVLATGWCCPSRSGPGVGIPTSSCSGASSSPSASCSSSRSISPAGFARPSGPDRRQLGRPPRPGPREGEGLARRPLRVGGDRHRPRFGSTLLRVMDERLLADHGIERTAQPEAAGRAADAAASSSRRRPCCTTRQRKRASIDTVRSRGTVTSDTTHVDARRLRDRPIGPRGAGRGRTSGCRQTTTTRSDPVWTDGGRPCSPRRPARPRQDPRGAVVRPGAGPGVHPSPVHP